MIKLLLHVFSDIVTVQIHVYLFKYSEKGVIAFTKNSAIYFIHVLCTNTNGLWFKTGHFKGPPHTWKRFCLQAHSSELHVLKDMDFLARVRLENDPKIF